MQIGNSTEAGMAQSYADSLNYNITFFNFTECNEDLRKFYHLPEESEFSYSKIELYKNGEIAPEVLSSYQVYDSIGNKLNISICTE